MERVNQLVNLCGIEERFRSLRREIGERRFVQQRRIHHAMLCQVVDDQVDKFDLVRTELLTNKKAREQSWERWLKILKDLK